MRHSISRKLMFCVLALVALLGVTASVSAASPKLNHQQKSIFVGNTLILKASDGHAASWSSSNNAVATVSDSGKVTGKSKGTVIISAKVDGVKVQCTVNVRSKAKSKYLTNQQMDVMLNILGAVETGGQVYGQRDYADFTNPGANSSSEYSCTAGAYQEYGDNLRQLLLQIKKEYPATFKKYDTAGIAADLNRVWSDSNPYTVRKGSKKANAIVAIISNRQGQVVQDYRAMDLIDSYIGHARRMGITNVRTAMLLAECEHLGGPSPVERVIRRAVKKNNFNSMWKSLMLDQKDTSNSLQIGDKFYQTRHEKCRTWILQHVTTYKKLKV